MIFDMWILSFWAFEKFGLREFGTFITLSIAIPGYEPYNVGYGERYDIKALNFNYPFLQYSYLYTVSI